VLALLPVAPTKEPSVPVTAGAERGAQ